jgi:hypothetical protein
MTNTQDCEILIERIINAPRELVWEAWTDPKHLEKWWGPNGFTTTTKEFDFRVGGVWRHVMHGPDGTNYPNEQDPNAFATFMAAARKKARTMRSSRRRSPSMILVTRRRLRCIAFLLLQNIVTMSSSITALSKAVSSILQILMSMYSL